MLSFGYSMLLREIQVSLETHGLNSYFGFFHRDAEKSPSLACDLIEEWRAVIVDATVMSAVNKHIIRREHFEQEDGKIGIYFTKEGVRIFIEGNGTEVKHKNTVSSNILIIHWISVMRLICR